MLRSMKLGENSAILGTELTRRTIAYRTRIRVMTPINRMFLKATPMRAVDRYWRRRKHLRELIKSNAGQRVEPGFALEAEARLAELTRAGIGPGPFAGESIAARGPGRDFTASERREINRILNQAGCHTWGTFNPATMRGDVVLDHQPSTRWNPHNRPQRLYPQCLSCSGRQGNWIMRNSGTR